MVRMCRCVIETVTSVRRYHTCVSGIAMDANHGKSLGNDNHHLNGGINAVVSSTVQECNVDYYVITVTGIDGRTWSCQKRFHDFQTLAEMLAGYGVEVDVGGNLENKLAAAMDMFASGSMGGSDVTP